MNREYLYKVFKKPKLGTIDDTYIRLASWFDDDSKPLLKKKFLESSFAQVLIKLIDIFRDGNPDYIQMIELFDSTNIHEVKQDGFRVYNLVDVKRINDDIDRIKLEIKEDTLVIHRIYLYTKDLQNHKELKENINTEYPDITYYGISEQLEIHEKECTIFVIDSKAK